MVASTSQWLVGLYRLSSFLYWFAWMRMGACVCVCVLVGKKRRVFWRWTKMCIYYVCIIFRNNHTSACNSISRAEIDELLTFRPFTFMYSCSLTSNRSLDSLSLFHPLSHMHRAILIFVFVCEQYLYSIFRIFCAYLCPLTRFLQCSPSSLIICSVAPFRSNFNLYTWMNWPLDSLERFTSLFWVERIDLNWWTTKVIWMATNTQTHIEIHSPDCACFVRFSPFALVYKHRYDELVYDGIGTNQYYPVLGVWQVDWLLRCSSETGCRLRIQCAQFQT